MNGFRVWNETDGIHASPNSFPSRASAQKFIDEFRKRFKIQGYYAAADGTRIPPDQVELEIISSKPGDKDSED